MNDHAIKVALVTGSAPFGGSTFFLLFLASGLRQMGVACEVFSFGDRVPGVASDFEKANVPLHSCDEKQLIFEDRLAQTYAALAHFRPTVVLANISDEAYEILRYVPPGTVRIGVVHDWWMKQRIPTYRDILDHVVVGAAHLVEDVQAVSPDTPCTYLPYGIPVPKDVPRRAPNPTRPLKLIYFGRFSDVKGSRIYPAVIDVLHSHRVPFQWTFHGCGPDETFIRQRLAAEIASGQVSMSAPVPREQLYALVRQHDIYVLASVIEGGPLTLLEGMVLGLVPICGDIPCLVQEVIKPENGFRVPRTEPEAYAEAVSRLHQDRALLERMSAAAYQAVTTHYSQEAMADRYLKLVTSLVRKPIATDWPEAIRPRPIRALENRILYWPVLRPVRRVAKRLGIVMRQS